MHRTTLSEYIHCDYATFEALRDATSVQLEHFAHQDLLPVSQSFLKAFPPTRAGEPLSGLWDFHYRHGLRRTLSPSYSPPNVDVVWHQDCAWVYARNNEVSTSTLTNLIAHVCRKYLPVSISWISHHDSLAPGSVGGSCVLIDEGGEADGDCTWNTRERWTERLEQAHRAEVPERDYTKTMTDLIARISYNVTKNDVGKCAAAKAGIIIIYIPDSLSPNDRDAKYKSAINDMLCLLEHTVLMGCSTWLQKPGDEAGGYTGSELAIRTTDLDNTLSALQLNLPAICSIEGLQLQYIDICQPQFSVYRDGQWSKYARIDRRDIGQAIAFCGNTRDH